jgi:hypothetical protein
VDEADTLVTTTSITAVSASTRSSHAALKLPDWIQCSTGATLRFGMTRDR